MATPLSLILSGGFSVFLAALLSTIVILLLFERGFIAKNAWMRWTVGSLAALLALYMIVSRPSVVPLTGSVMAVFLMLFAFVLLICMLLGGRWVFYHKTKNLMTVCLAIIAVSAIAYSVGDKMLSVSSQDVVLGTGEAAFSPFGMPVLGMALFLTLGSVLVYSFVKFSF